MMCRLEEVAHQSMFTAPIATYSFTTQMYLSFQVHLSHPEEHCTGVLLVVHGLGPSGTHHLSHLSDLFLAIADTDSKNSFKMYYPSSF